MIPWPVLVNRQVKKDLVFAEQARVLTKQRDERIISEEEYAKKLVKFLEESTKRVSLESDK